jgi:hypothetical protein
VQIDTVNLHCNSTPTLLVVDAVVGATSAYEVAASWMSGRHGLDNDAPDIAMRLLVASEGFGIGDQPRSLVAQPSARLGGVQVSWSRRLQ